MYKLYTIGCPKCKVLEMKMRMKKIEFEIVSDMNEIKSKGLTNLPYLEKDGKLYNFVEAIKIVNEQ